MPWGKMDDKFHSNAKVRALRRTQAGREALGTWVFWWSKVLDDPAWTGVVPAHELPAHDHKCAKALVEVGLWEPHGEDFKFHDFELWNPDPEVKRKRDRERIAAERADSLQRRSGDVAATSQNGSSVVALSPSPSPSPSPSRSRSVQIVSAASPPDTSAAIRAQAWDAYAFAHQRRYADPKGPTRNAKVNSQIKQFCQRVPAEDVVATIEHYLRSPNARYVAAGHTWGPLLQDAEKLVTEARTGRSVTAHVAHQADRKAGRLDQYNELFAKLDAEESERKGQLNG